MAIGGSKMGTGGYGGGSKDSYKKPSKGTKTVSAVNPLGKKKKGRKK